MGAWFGAEERGYYAGGMVTGISDHGNIGGFGDKMEETCTNINAGTNARRMRGVSH